MQNIAAINIETLSLPLDMKQYSNRSRLNGTPLPMQYLGSKTRITKWIITSIKKYLPNDDKLFDLMAGTGAVAYEAIRNGFFVGANDIQPYSYVILRSLINTPRDGLSHVISLLRSKDKDSELISNGRLDFSQYLQKEDQFIKDLENSKFDWYAYNDFCKEIPIVNSIDDINRTRKKGEWNLFTNYYSNTYFGVRQCLELDLLRELSESLDENQKTHLLAATISSMTFNVSSTTHLAQYLKPNSQTKAVSLLKRRKKSMIKSVLTRLENLLLDNNYSEKFIIQNLDFKDAIPKLHGNWVVYADPPYFKEHYSRYYHVLDTFYLYDYPELTFNPRLNHITMGRYRANRISSEFGRKAEARMAFKKLIAKSKDSNLDLVVSYANTSLVSKEDILSIGKQFGYKCIVLEQKLLHSGQGQPRNKTVTEYLFIFSR